MAALSHPAISHAAVSHAAVSLPSSRASTAHNRPSTSERLTPMPDYMRPLTRGSAKKFRKLHEDLMMTKLIQKRSANKERNIKTRDQARQLAIKVPLDILAKDWFSSEDESVETRAYLVDKIMPTLVLGLEKLLVEVGRKGLADKDEPDPNFNPINYLAQYLMRNNPRFSNFSEASPYVRGLRSVGEELKKQLFDLEENRLVYFFLCYLVFNFPYISKIVVNHYNLHYAVMCYIFKININCSII